jgi:lysine 6-dehydrogenase
MHVLVLGCGKIGRACVREFSTSDLVDEVTVVDQSREALSALGENVEPETRHLDVTDVDAVRPLIRGTDCVVGATTPAHYLSLTEAAIDAGAHWVDFGGDETVLHEQYAYDDRAQRAGVSVVPACGLAPGVCNMLVTYGAAQLDSVEEAAVRVGGLPLDPQPPLNYSLEFSVKGLVAEYVLPVEIIRDGARTEVPALEGSETLHFDQVGQLEAFFTAGALASLPDRLDSKVDELTYKTLRYPGHREKIEVLRDLGFLNAEPVKIDKTAVSPRAMTENRLAQTLPSEEPDLVIARITIAGQIDGDSRRLVYELYDEFHEPSGMSAMMRTTAFPTVEIARQAMTGQLRHGVTPAEGDVPVEPVLRFMRDRGIEIRNISE